MYLYAPFTPTSAIALMQPPAPLPGFRKRGKEEPVVAAQMRQGESSISAVALGLRGAFLRFLPLISLCRTCTTSLAECNSSRKSRAPHQETQVSQEEGRGERRGEGQSNIIGPCYKRRRPTVAATPHVSRSAQAAPEQSTRMVKLFDSYYRAYRICFPVATGVFLILPEMRKRERIHKH